MLDVAFLAPHALARRAETAPDAIAVQHGADDRRTFAEHASESCRRTAAFRLAGGVTATAFDRGAGR